MKGNKTMQTVQIKNILDMIENQVPSILYVDGIQSKELRFTKFIQAENRIVAEYEIIHNNVCICQTTDWQWLVQTYNSIQLYDPYIYEKHLIRHKQTGEIVFVLMGDAIFINDDFEVELMNDFPQSIIAKIEEIVLPDKQHVLSDIKSGEIVTYNMYRHDQNTFISKLNSGRKLF